MLDQEKRIMIQSDIKKSYAAIFLIRHFIKIQEIEEGIELLIELVQRYVNYLTNDNFKLISVTYRELFYLLNKFNMNEHGYHFFSRVSDSLNINKFYNTKSYAVYFAYQLKQYDLIENIKNTFFIQFQSVLYGEAYDFSMMNFYKGLIFLSNKVNFYFNFMHLM